MFSGLISWKPTYLWITKMSLFRAWMCFWLGRRKCSCWNKLLVRSLFLLIKSWSSEMWRQQTSTQHLQYIKAPLQLAENNYSCSRAFPYCKGKMLVKSKGRSISCVWHLHSDVITYNAERPSIVCEEGKGPPTTQRVSEKRRVPEPGKVRSKISIATLFLYPSDLTSIWFLNPRVNL